MNPEALILPHLNACLNGLSLILLIAALIAVRQRKLDLHKKLMLAATSSSALFLIFYLLHHYQVGSVPYPHQDWTRIFYFIVLIPHIILAALMVPFIFMALYHGLKNNLEKHKRIVRYLFPVWVYVSVTGLIVYWMLYQ